jgi:undecaprenyl-diphosphatase
MSVLSYVMASDDRVSGRVVAWRPPRWVRLWMLWASKLGDGWLWLALALALAASGERGLKVLAGAAVSLAVANVVLVLTKSRIHRPRPCERARPAHFEVDPLTWFPADRFSFPSGHALNAFAMNSVIALAFPLLAAPALLVATSVAASRVVLGLHWLSDVLAGTLVGTLIGATVWLALLH